MDRTSIGYDMGVLGFGFIQRALVAGVVIALLSALVGALVVIRRLSGVGAGLSHTAFGGLALGKFIGLDPMIVAGFFTVGLGFLIAYAERHSKVSTDTWVGITFSFGMALGVLVLTFVPGYTDVMGYLFGSILSVSVGDIALALSVFAVVCVVYFFYGRVLVYATFDRDNQQIQGINVIMLDYLLMGLVALTVVASIKVVGVVLTSALLVIPAATAFLVCSRFFQALFIAVLLSVVEVVGGVFISITLDLPTGAVIVTLSTVVLLLALPIRWACRCLFAKRS